MGEKHEVNKTLTSLRRSLKKERKETRNVFTTFIQRRRKEITTTKHLYDAPWKERNTFDGRMEGIPAERPVGRTNLGRKRFTKNHLKEEEEDLQKKEPSEGKTKRNNGEGKTKRNNGIIMTTGTNK